MKTGLDCLPCFLKSVVSALEGMDLPDAEKQKTALLLADGMKQVDFHRSPPENAEFFYSALGKLTGTPDPFRQIKKENPTQYLEILKSLKRTPMLSVRVNLLKYSCEEFEEYLAREEIDIVKKVETVYYLKAGNILDSSEFQEGKIIVQDAASYLAAKNLGAKA